MGKTRFSLGVLAACLMVIFGLFGASHFARTIRAQQSVAGAGFKPALTRSAMPAAKGISSLPLEAQASISRSIGADLPAYQVRRAGADPAGSAIFAARNARNKLLADFTAQGVVVQAGTARWKMTLTGYGYGDNLKSVTAAAPTGKANRVEYRRGALTEWYVNGPMGLEQGFTFKQPPASEHRVRNSSTLTLALALSGDLAAKIDTNGKGLTLSGSNHKSRLRYAGLTATDASGKELPASLELRGQDLLLKVSDSGARYPLTVDPFVQLAELTASDGAPFDELGYSVAISGSTVVAGAGGNSTDTGGIVYVFVKPETGWANMTETAELTASDGVAGNELGYSVAVSGNTVVAGAPRTTVGSNSQQGAAYVFVEPASGWVNMTETAKLIASDGAAADNFGTSAAITGGTVVVGAAQEYTGPGAAYVFVQPPTGWKTTSQFRAKLTASDGVGGAELGASLDISGGTVVAGAPRKPAAYVFVKPTGGWTSMTQTAELTAPLQRSGDLGLSVAISGGTVVAGSPAASPAGRYSGAADVFVEPATGWVNMTPTAVLTASDEKADDQLGSSVAINGKTVVVGDTMAGIGRNGDQGAAYVFVEPASGWANMTQNAKLIASDGQAGDLFGFSVAITGSTMVIGATFAGGNGAAYVFEKTQ